MYRLEENQYLSLMYSMYANALNNTPSYTHVRSYVVCKVHLFLALGF